MDREMLKKMLEDHTKWLCGIGDNRINLTYADLRYANLRDADLRYANLAYADLTCADLTGADLTCADLRDVDLTYANLKDANLTHADLTGADLRGVDLRNANLTGADLNNCIISYPLNCPEVGSFIGWKKAKGLIVKLEICEDALRSSSTTRKCRCSKAKVLAIETLDGKSGPSKVASSRDDNFIYSVGEIVEVKDFDTNRWEECSTGIHFFITRDEAVRYW